jgi:hypothetical protein
VDNGVQHASVLHGELNCEEILRGMNIKFITEAKLLDGKTRRYDFYFEYSGKHWLLEFDGIQHFKYKSAFHSKPGDDLESKQNMDRSITFRKSFKMLLKKICDVIPPPRIILV